MSSPVYALARQHPHSARPGVVRRLSAAWRSMRSLGKATTVGAVAASFAAPPTVGTSLSLTMGLVVSGTACALAALVDANERKLPNALTATVVVAAFCAAMVHLVMKQDPWPAWSGVGGLLIGGGLMLSVFLARGVGMGDVKMAAAVGASCATVSLIAAPVAIAIAAMSAATVGLIGRRDRLPLGPSLWIGWCLALVMTATGAIG